MATDIYGYKKDHEKLLHIELIEWLQSTDKRPVDDYQIIDLRTADFIGGNIKSAINVRYDEFIDKIPMIINTYYKTPNIIFHCMYSQKRGPDSLDWYCQSLNAILNNDQEQMDRLIENEHEDFEALTKMKPSNEQLKYLKQQNIYLLFQGFRGFLLKVGVDSDLIVNYDSDYWTEEMQHTAEIL